MRTLRYTGPFQKRGAELLAYNVAVGIVTGVEIWARSNIMEFGFEIREVLTLLNCCFKDKQLLQRLVCVGAALVSRQEMCDAGEHPRRVLTNR